MDLVKSLNTLHTDTILQLVKEVVKKPHQIKGEQVNTCTRSCSSHVWKRFNLAALYYFSEVSAGRYPHVTVQLRLHPKVSGRTWWFSDSIQYNSSNAHFFCF